MGARALLDTCPAVGFVKRMETDGLADRRRGPAPDRPALRHRGNGPGPRAGGPSGRPRPNWRPRSSPPSDPGSRRSFSRIPRSSKLAEGHPVRARHLARAHALPRRRAVRARHHPGREPDPSDRPGHGKTPSSRATRSAPRTGAMLALAHRHLQDERREPDRPTSPRPCARSSMAIQGAGSRTFMPWCFDRTSSLAP